VTPMSGFRVRSRRLRRRSRPGMTVWGGAKRLNISSYLPLTPSPSGLYSPSSCPTERGDRDRHVRGVGCGGRRRCGVTRFMGERLSSGRTDLRQHCHWQGDGRPSDGKIPGQCDGRPNRNAFGQVLCGYPVPPPWDINFGDGTVRHGRCASNRKNTAGGTSGTCSAPPKVLMHSQLRKTAFASGPRVQRAPGVPHALSQGAGMRDTTAPPRRKQWGR
jgi:hypothetical protein